MVLEVCVDSVASALSAVRGGADRLELCSSLNEGGLTPSFGFFTVVKRLVNKECAIFVMIRPKAGESYIYDEREIEIMVEDIKMFKENGVDGFVFGCLNKSKDVDEENCLKLLKAAQDLPCTFHRAFDVVSDPESSLVRLIQLGFARILTSGQEKNAFLGRHSIKKLVSKVGELGSSLIIVAGGGISPDNLKEILLVTKVKEYHGSARVNPVLPCEQKTCIYTTDESVVKCLVNIGQIVSEGSV